MHVVKKRSITKEIEHVASAIARDVPLIDGSTWSPTFNPQWPKDYTEHEKSRIRALAAMAIAAIREFDQQKA